MVRKATSRSAKVKRPKPTVIPLPVLRYDALAGRGELPKVQVVGYALLGDRECAHMLWAVFEREEAAAAEEIRQPSHDEYVLAWLEDGRRSLLAEGVDHPNMRQIYRVLGFVRKGAHGNAPKRLAPLHTYAAVIAKAASGEGRVQAKFTIADDIERKSPKRVGARDRVKMVEEHITSARKMVEVGNVLALARSPEDLSTATPRIAAMAAAVTRESERALARGIMALKCLPSLGAKTADLVRRYDEAQTH